MGGSAHSDTQVKVDAGRVTIHAASTPLADILSRFGQVTGAEVVYETTRPQQVVSVGIDTDSEADAVLRLLEGQGLNYVLRLDPTGREVEMLVIVGKAGTAGPTAATGGSANTRRERASRPPEPEPDEDVIQTFTPEPVVEEPAERTVVAPPSPPSLPSPSPSDRGGIPVWNPSQPQTPVPVSNPGTMRPPTLPTVPAPSAPAPASYPRE